MVQIDNLRKSYEGSLILNGFNLDLHKGEFVVLLGPSGVGKTTLIRMIAGVERPDSGRILIGDQDMIGLPPERRPVTTMWQFLGLFPHLSVSENVAFSLRCKGWGRADAARRVSELLSLVSLSGYQSRTVATLSGGEQQRVALVRCLAAAPQLLLLDEPLGALDEQLRREMVTLLKTLHKDTEGTFLMVTHRVTEALSCAARLAIMFDGRIEAFDSPERVYTRPPTVRVASFLGSNNVFTVNHGHCSLDECVVETKVGFLKATQWEHQGAGEASFYSVRPNEVQLFPPDSSVHPGWNSVSVSLEEISYEGSVKRMRLSTNGQTLEAELPIGQSSCEVVVGRRYNAAWPGSAGFCRIAASLCSLPVELTN